MTSTALPVTRLYIHYTGFFVDIAYTEFNPNQTSVANMGKISYMALSEVWFSLQLFSQNS
jgi:hypothetical protein